jgi:hypothetical protein
VFTFTGPATVSHRGTFHLGLQCVNRSNNVRNIRLKALRRSDINQEQEPPASHTQGNQVTASTERNSRIDREPPSVLIETPEVRIGSIAAGASFESSSLLRYRAVGTGLLDMGVVRIIDVDSQQTVDTSELPDIVCLQDATE